jgi:hypothetical protein
VAKPMWPVAPVMRTRGLLSSIFAMGLVGCGLVSAKARVVLRLS